MNLTMRQAWISIRLLIVMTVVLGVVYPLAVFAVGRIVPSISNGSYVTDASGTVVGSSLIGQTFDGEQWFQPRPSAAGEGYDALSSSSSSGSNLGPNNPDLVDAIAERQAAAAVEDGVAPESVPADAVTASGSGLDPDISPEYAQQQVARAAAARGFDAAVVATLVDDSRDATQGRFLGFIGEPRVNVLELNLALENLG
jgi:K+-transporting ATPase ATPase C chain